MMTPPALFYKTVPGVLLGRFVFVRLFGKSTVGGRRGGSLSRATWFTDCATTWFTHLLLDHPLLDKLF